MDAILSLRPEDFEDYYGLLGCDELSSSEQILTEYKIKALECHPDKHPDNPKAAEEFQKLQEAKEILTDENSRKSYDYWRRSRIAVPFREWQALSQSVKTSMHWAVKSKKEPMLEASKDTKENVIMNATDKDTQTERQPSVELQSPITPTSPGESHWHLRFRWTSDAPSELLRKFRNYEI
ncbi:DnaJ subfamily C member 12-like [Scleropages formosus]|uniref:DnaJ homolog subfamily C member 12 n=1 Tax=Scleropages formosus TaxID=113540 RepID=A0A0P7V4W1_SCLFO|nr:dnaJ homolog subfamily C member 12 [Scleropages formosus]KPP76572.1 DnaJ subfamily C member 12-like [Scleropages formosus]